MIMKMRGLAIIVLLFGSLFAAGMAFTGPDETNKQIISALTAGDAHALSAYMNKMIDLGIAGNEGSYSKTQATRILMDFFQKNPVKSVKINKKGTSSDGSFFSLGEMEAGGKKYRVYYLLKNVDGNYLIHLMQLQETK
jgi:hypothetical protein